MPSPLDQAMDEAIHWMVRLRSGRDGAEDRQSFERWHASDASHAEAWGRLQQTVDQPFDTVRAVDGRLPGQAMEARRLLLQPSRRTLLRSLGGLGIAACAGVGLLAADRLQPLGALVADFSTGTGERRTFSLDDGSRLTLNARTRVDADFTQGTRHLMLREGDIVVQVAPDAARPFVVSTLEADTRALGTRFSVRQEAGATRVAVLAHSVEVRGLHGERQVLQAREGARIDAAGIGRLAEDQVDAAEWQQGLLVVNRRPLSEVVGELQRYRRDVLRVSPAAADILVQGVFRLDDVDRALLALAETLPITVTRYGPWLTTIERR